MFSKWIVLDLCSHLYHFVESYAFRIWLLSWHVPPFYAICLLLPPVVPNGRFLSVIYEIPFCTIIVLWSNYIAGVEAVAISLWKLSNVLLLSFPVHQMQCPFRAQSSDAGPVKFCTRKWADLKVGDEEFCAQRQSHHSSVDYISGLGSDITILPSKSSA